MMLFYFLVFFFYELGYDLDRFKVVFVEEDCVNI